MKLKLGKILTLPIKTALFGCCLALCASTASAQEITAIDFNGDLIGKVIPDGKVVSFENQLIGNITADSLIVDFEGNLIGGVVPKGIAIGNDNRLLGKVNNDGTVRLATGKIVGKVLPNGLVVDDRFSVLGAVLFPGLVYSDKGETVGRLTGDGLYSNLQGQTVGFVSPDGYAYRKVGNDYVLDGRLISAKMIIDASGKFIGSIAPGGKVTDFDGKALGLIKANGFAYDSQDKIIGRVVKSGYAFDNNGKYIGFVTYNGEVVNKNKTVGHLQIDGTIADDKGKVIGFMADIASTVTDATGKYIGRIMPEGKIAQVRNFVGEIGPRHIVFGTDGKEIGRLLVSGPVFDYRGALRGHALKNGQVILLEGTPVGSIYGSRASDYNGRNIGKTFESRLVVNSLNQVLGVNGISSAFNNGEEKKYLSPFGYVFNADGGIDGNLLPLGDIYNQNGEPIASIYPNGEMVNNNAAIDGRLTQYGYSINDQNLILGKNIDVAYAVDYQGNSLGILADGNMLLDKNLRNIAKILPDGEVVSDVSNPAAMMPVVGKALNRSLAVTFQGRFYGYIDDSGTVRDLGSSIVGKTGAGDVVFDNNGHPVAGAVSYMPAINDQCEFIGVVTAQGEVRNYREVSMGHVLPNGQVYSVNNAIIGHAFNPGSIIDFSGNIIGTVASTGKVINYANQNMGCVNRRGLVLDSKNAIIGKLVEIAPVMNFNNVITGRSTMDGTVINGQNTVIGYIRPDDSVSSKTGLPTGILFKYRYAFNNNNRLIGTVNDRAEVIDNRGRNIGMVDFDGNVIIGSSKSGYALYDMYIYDNDNYVMGYISADGQVLSLSNRNLGALTKGFLVDKNGRAIGRGNRDFQIRNNLNAIIGELQLDGRVINSDNELVGTLGASGDIIAPGGEVIARARPLQFYEAVRRQPIYDKDGNIIGYVTTEMQAVDAQGNVIGRIGDQEYALAYDANGNLLGYVDENGNVIDANGKIVGKMLDNGAIIDAGSVLGRAEEQERTLAFDADGNLLGYVDENGNVRDLKGNIIGRVDENGNVIDAQGNTIGRADPSRKGRLAFDASGNLLGYVDEKGNVIDSKGNVIGKMLEDGTIIDSKSVLGQVETEERTLAFDANGNLLGYVDENGNVVDLKGNIVGKVDENGNVVDAQGNVIGRADPSRKGRIARDADGNIIGYADENGNVIDANGNVIGQVTADGTVISAKNIMGKAGESRKLVYDENGKVIGYVDEKGNVRDLNNRIIGEVVAGGEIVDANGNVIGMLNKDGSAVSPNGEVFGNLKLNWYEKPQPTQPADLPEIGARTVTDVGQFKRSLNIALTPDGEYLGDILENGNVVDKNGKVIGKLLPDGLVVDAEGSLIGIEEAAKKSDTGEMFVPAGTFGQGGAYGIGTGGGNLGPGGGFGPGERYDPQRAAALQAAQNERRKGMYVGKLSTGVRREAFDGYQKDWADQGIDKTISSWRVDMSLMILADKPIPAVIARSIDTEHPVPVTAFVERNVYAEDGRNVVIPAGSRLIGELGGTSQGTETSSESARVTIAWQRLIRPDGVLFTFQGVTGDASGRGGALGYYDQQLGKKYGMPLITTLLTSATSYMMATDEENNTMETETSRQQAANDARENFIDQMNQIFNMILADKTNIKALTYIPAGTRIIVYPKIDLWLRTAELDAEASTNMQKKDVLIDDEEAQDRIATQAAERRIKQASGTGGSVSSQVVYESEQSAAQPVLLDDSSSKSGRAPSSSIGATPPPPPPSSGSSSSSSSSSSSTSGSGVPQLF